MTAGNRSSCRFESTNEKYRCPEHYKRGPPQARQGVKRARCKPKRCFVPETKREQRRPPVLTARPLQVFILVPPLNQLARMAQKRHTYFRRQETDRWCDSTSNNYVTAAVAAAEAKRVFDIHVAVPVLSLPPPPT